MAKKNFTRDSSLLNRQADDEVVIDPEQPIAKQMDAAAFGRVDISERERVQAVGLRIEEIVPDLRQPRRAIPASVRGAWDGSAATIPAMLTTWHQQAVAAVGMGIDPLLVMRGAEGALLALEKAPAIYEDYVDLLRLAASIRAQGQVNPITVQQMPGRYRIETGERRWLAHWLLTMYVDEDRYSRVLARIVDQADVWRQASENGVRKSLNAIGMARQLALLIIEARQQSGESIYREYDEMVKPGGCDRAYFAQVADGNIHRIPKGMGEKIQAAMGIKKDRLSQYRNLLALTGDDLVDDALWTEADVQNWGDAPLREIAAISLPILREGVRIPGWTLDTLRNVQRQVLTGGRDPLAGPPKKAEIRDFENAAPALPYSAPNAPEAGDRLNNSTYPPEKPQPEAAYTPFESPALPPAPPPPNRVTPQQQQERSPQPPSVNPPAPYLYAPGRERVKQFAVSMMGLAHYVHERDLRDAIKAALDMSPGQVDGADAAVYLRDVGDGIRGLLLELLREWDEMVDEVRSP